MLQSKEQFENVEFENMEKNWKTLRELCIQAGITDIHIEYSGSGDSGGITDVSVMRKMDAVLEALGGDKKRRSLYVECSEFGKEFGEFVEQVAYNSEEVLQGGFDDDGSQGWIHFIVDAGEVHVHDEVNEMTYSTNEKAYTIDGCGIENEDVEFKNEFDGLR